MNDIFAGLNDSQRAAVNKTEGPLIIFAGAGTGKTRVITCRVAHLLAKGTHPSRILAVTFTNKAAAEMRRRVDDLAPGRGRGVWISTFHSFGAQFLRTEAKRIGLNPSFVIYDTTDQKQVIRECLNELSFDEKTYKSGRIIEIISRAKDELLDAQSYAIHALASADPFRQNAAAIYTLYQKKLDRAGALDFGDLLMRTVNALNEQPELLAHYQQRFTHVMVDEYQDTNHAQYLLVRHLAALHKNICVVGDDDQSIYSWRGADIRNILEFERDYPDVSMVKLEQNYRSTPEILNAAWKVVRNNSKRVEKKLWTGIGEGAPMSIMECSDEMDEARRVVERVQAHLAAGEATLSGCAVFYRTNAQSRVFEDAFRRAGLAYAVVGSMRFYERAEVKDVLAYLRLLNNPDDSVSFKRVINVPRRGIGKASVDALEARARDRGVSLWSALDDLEALAISGGMKTRLRDFQRLVTEFKPFAATHTVKEITLALLDRTRYMRELEAENTIESRSRIENIQELVTAMDEFERISPDKSMAGYLTQVSLATDLDKTDETQDRATLMTLHLAKGLEFTTVFVTGLEEGLFPIGEAAFDPAELEEERRLMYVGMTRARRFLTLSWAAERRVYGKSRWSLASRFVAEANADGTAIVSPTIPHDSADAPVIARRFGPPPEHAAPRTAPSADPVSAKYPLEARVRHSTFGEGKIIDKSGAGEDLKLVVLFDSGEWKKLLVKYAPLEVI